MKAFYFLIPLLVVNACKTQTGTVITSAETVMEKSENIRSECPEDGTCEVIIHKNQTLEIVDDAGNLFPQIIEGQNIVVEYTYRRLGPAGTADGNYSEILYFEVSPETSNFTKENEELTDVKMLLGILGYRNVSYYELMEGKLVFTRTDNSLSFDFRFKIDQASHVISHIKEKVQF